MANQPKGFTVATGKRPSGARYWIVRGTAGTKQVRKEFPDRTEALSFQEKMHSDLFGVASSQAPVLTHLAPTQVRDAEVMFGQLAQKHPTTKLHEVVEFYDSVSGVMNPSEARQVADALQRLRKKHPEATLAEVCDHFLTTYHSPKRSVSLQVALEHYLGDLLRRRNTNTLSEWQYRSVGFASQRLEKYFGAEAKLHALTTSRLQAFLAETSVAKDGSGNFANKTWSNRRSYLTSFFGFCQQEGWISDNPATGIRKFSKKDFPKKKPEILSAATTRELMTYAERFADGRLVPYLVLTTMCGVRPSYKDSEITRLKPEYISLERAELRLPGPETKTKKTRVVKLQPNVVAWLKAYPLDQCPIVCRNFRKLLFQLRQKFSLGHDVLRHTYCSMLVGQTRSVADAALQAGNSEGVLWANYLDLVDETSAADFWSILPAKGMLPDA